MCNSKEKLYIHNLNRVAIAGATIVATLINGIDAANCLYLASAIAWLFLPECDSAEEHVLGRLKITCNRVLQRTPAQNDTYQQGALAYTTETVNDSTQGR